MHDSCYGNNNLSCLYGNIKKVVNIWYCFYCAYCDLGAFLVNGLVFFSFLLILHAQLCTFALLPDDICGALEMPLLLSVILVIILLLLLLLLFQTHGVLQRIDRRLITKIDELVGEGVRSVSEMQNHLLQYLKSDVFRGQALPPKCNRQYFPSEKTVRNHMYLARQREMFSKCDL